MAKAAPQVRLSKAEILAHRDVQLRGECIPIAMSCGAKTVADMLLGADMIYAWVKSRQVPALPHAAEVARDA